MTNYIRRLESNSKYSIGALWEAKDYVKEHSVSELKALLEVGVDTRENLLRECAGFYKIKPLGSVKDITIEEDVLREIGFDFLVQNRFLPAVRDDVIFPLVVDPDFRMEIKDWVKDKCPNYRIGEMYLIWEDDFISLAVANGVMREESKLTDMLEHVSVELQEVPSTNDNEDIGEYDTASIQSIVNQLLVDAFNSEASDIHVEPRKDVVIVRLRINGLLIVHTQMDKSIHKQLVSRIKTISDLDTLNQRTPQSGRLRRVYKGTVIDARVSTLPTIYGEKITMRLIKGDEKIRSLEDLGFTRDQCKKLRTVCKQPNGIVLISGPTGSGKSSTLASILSELNTVDKNIITIEDPVEYRIEGLVQVNVNDKTNLTFPTVLREVLRQDPDIIMVGEIRDSETADIALKASNTGHLVLSTIHTNTAISAIDRLLDMGVESYMVSATLKAVANQKLVRVLCPNCKKALTPEELLPYEDLLGSGYTVYKPAGCSVCHGTGYVGRTILVELLLMDRGLIKLSSSGASSDDLYQYAISQGMVPAKDEALRLVREGITGIEELHRVISIS